MSHRAGHVSLGDPRVVSGPRPALTNSVTDSEWFGLSTYA